MDGVATIEGIQSYAVVGREGVATHCIMREWTSDVPIALLMLCKGQHSPGCRTATCTTRLFPSPPRRPSDARPQSVIRQKLCSGRVQTGRLAAGPAGGGPLDSPEFGMSIGNHTLDLSCIQSPRMPTLYRRGKRGAGGFWDDTQRPDGLGSQRAGIVGMARHQAPGACSPANRWNPVPDNRRYFGRLPQL